MCRSNFSDAKGNCSKEIGDQDDAENHGLINNKILDQQRQSNQSVDGANTFSLETSPTNAVPSPSIGNQLQTLAEPESAGINVESRSLIIFQTPALPKRKRMADVIDGAKYTQEIHDGRKRLKKANTSSGDGHASLRDRRDSMEKSLKRQKKILVYWKKKGNELTAEITDLSMHLLQTESFRSENGIQLQERLAQLTASNAQLVASIAQLNSSIAQLEASIVRIVELEASIAREVNEENGSELGQAKN